MLGLPVGIRDPLSRLAAVKQRMDRLKGSPEALATHGLLRAMGWAPRPVEDLGVWFFGTKASIVLTNVPGPRTPLKLAGEHVSRIMFWVPQSGRMGIGISIFSYAGTVTIGIIVGRGPRPRSGRARRRPARRIPRPSGASVSAVHARLSGRRAGERAARLPPGGSL